MNTNNTIHNGIVKYYNTERAYGFITDKSTSIDYFVHVSGLIDPIKMKDEVTFELKENDRGYLATNVRTVNKFIIININNK
jgi:CspA family cold shock protein